MFFADCDILTQQDIFKVKRLKIIYVKYINNNLNSEKIEIVNYNDYITNQSTFKMPPPKPPPELIKKVSKR